MIDLLIVPLPILWLLLLALLLWRWRRVSATLVVIATLLFALLAMPAVGRLLQGPLAAGAAPYLAAAAEPPLAVVVPSAGIFEDPAGRWWPAQGSIARGTVGQLLSERLGLPLVVSGGVLAPGEPAEAEILAKALGLVGPELRLETTGRNSAETGAAVAALLADEKGGSVLLVTDPMHVTRMAAALRHHGLAVLAAPWGAPAEPRGLADFVPSDRGLKMTRGALWEYMGIAWYLLTGQIDFADLSG